MRCISGRLSNEYLEKILEEDGCARPLFNLCGTGRVQEQEEERAGAKAELPFLQGRPGGRLMLEMKIGEIKIMALKCVGVMDYDDDSCEGCL